MPYLHLLFLASFVLKTTGDWNLKSTHYISKRSPIGWISLYQNLTYIISNSKSTFLFFTWTPTRVAGCGRFRTAAQCIQLEWNKCTLVFVFPLQRLPPPKYWCTHWLHSTQGNSHMDTWWPGMKPAIPAQRPLGHMEGPNATFSSYSYSSIRNSRKETGTRAHWIPTTSYDSVALNTTPPSQLQSHNRH